MLVCFSDNYLEISFCGLEHGCDYNALMGKMVQIVCGRMKFPEGYAISLKA